MRIAASSLLASGAPPPASPIAAPGLSPVSADFSSKIGLAQIEVIPGRPDLNFQTYLRRIEEAKGIGLEVIVFPEMSLTGYLLGDEWENDELVCDFVHYNEEVRKASQGITVIWGGVHAEADKKGEDGRVRKYNAAFVARDGKWIGGIVAEGRTYKSLMPKYRMFDDERHFYSTLRVAHERGATLKDLLKPFEVEMGGRKVRLGVILCEDMWSDDYTDQPVKILIGNGAEAIVNISCSPWTWRKNDKRHRVVEGLMRDTRGIPFFYCNNIGTQNNGKNLFLFEGGSTIYGSGGLFLKSAAPYTEQILTLASSGMQVLEERIPLSEERDIQELFDGAIYGIRKFFEHYSPVKKAVIGLSGGIDSAVDAALLAIALGAENVYAINMPSKFNSPNTRNDARRIAEALGIPYQEIPIQGSVDETIQQLRLQGIDLRDFDIENVQARDRGSRVLAAVASRLGAIICNNGNKTETAFGYTTLYGDLVGGLCPLADLYKGQVYALARAINHTLGREVIPQSVMERIPSAELGDDQDVDKGLGDPFHYPYHDRLLYLWIELRRRPEDVLKMFLTGDLQDFLTRPIAGLPPVRLQDVFSTTKDFVKDLEQRWISFRQSYFKRVQAPPIITYSKRSFGFDLRETMPQAGVYFTGAFSDLRQQTLAKVIAEN